MDTIAAFDLHGRVALVTGASHGIGFAITSALGEAGATIAFNCHNEEHCKAALEKYRQAGINASGYVSDVTKEPEMQDMVERITKELGPIDILVNNAAVIKRIPMHEMRVEDWRKVVDTDLTSAFIMAKAVLPGMMERRHGKIINLCSMMSELGRETVSAYAAAKGGLKMLTRNIASEYGSTTSNAMRSGLAISLHHRPLPCSRGFRMAGATPSMPSFSPRPLQDAGDA